jgi:hypothetical protein
MDCSVIISSQFIYHLGEHNLILPWLYEPHIVTASLLFGIWYLDELFNITLWPVIRPYRNQLKDKVKKMDKEILNYLKSITFYWK